MSPDVSVVIPTFRRETRLAFALEALASQTLNRDRFEVIVVRVESEADEPSTSAPDGCVVRFVASPVAGTAAQRNLGWREARSDFIAFTDDDCRVSPGWLERLIESRGREDEIVQGRTEPDPDEVHLLHGLARTIRVSKPPSWYQTCNIAYPRALLERLAGFDESFEFLGEDVDLGCRARDAGAGLRFVEDALVWHAVHWRSLAEALRDIRKRRSFPGLLARHPQQREQLWFGVFSDLDHLRLLIAAAGLPFVKRAPALALVAALPYLQKRVDLARLTPWGLLRMPTQILSRVIVDVAETATFAASSARHRTLVL